MQKEILYGIIGLLAGILIGIFSASQAVNNNMTGMMGMMGMRFGSNGITGINMMNSAESIDAHFIEQMIPHHEDAITMANLALVKAEHPEIKTLSNDIIKSQSEEIDQMGKWYKEWFGKNVPDANSSFGGGMGMMMYGGMMGDATDLGRLETVKPFDKAFIEEMIPHHQMAVMMAQMLRNSTNMPEMKTLADNIIS